jgi:tryptophan halogenase
VRLAEELGFKDWNHPMSQLLVRQIVILGGGTAGWMTAAALSKTLNGKVAVTVVESDEIGTVGVGEATIPLITRFNQMLGVDEDDFLRATQGTFKLGIEFVDWARIGNRYMHGFGRYRQDIQLASFEQFWQKMAQGGHAHDLQAYSISKMAAYAGKFMRPRLDVPDSPLADLAHAFHFDASLYARYLRRYAEARAVRRIEGRVVDVSLHSESGHIASLTLATGEVVEGQFFVDCSGFRGRLIEEVLKTGYEDWSHWLPCDRAVAVPCASVAPLLPYTRATARSAGWQWRIPLQHRIGNGYVYSSQHMSDDAAATSLLSHLDGEALAAPRTLRFVTGMRLKAWNRNCLAIGLSSGFIEPLESTSIHLIQTAIGRLLTFFPTSTASEIDIQEYNRQSRREFEHVRDFIILHYHATKRDDSPFWDYCRTMRIPESLKYKMELYQSHGRVLGESDALFAEAGWVQVMHGQGLPPRSYHPIADVVEEKHLIHFFDGVRNAIQQCVKAMPTHEEFIGANCRALPPTT